LAKRHGNSASAAGWPHGFCPSNRKGRP
jgi:hypothetical protein